MESSQNQDMQQIFVSSTRNRPQRTYSHKGRSNRTFSLPSLKPVSNRSLPASTYAVLTRPLVTSPVSPPRHIRTTPSFSEQDESDPKDETEDDLVFLAQRPLNYNLKHDRRTGNGTRSLRRRPFLIFDRIEAKGYKQLEKIPQVGKADPSLRYQPGDGFSGREAKPNGSNLLARNGKMTFTSPHVGILDLTQSELPAAERKRAACRAHRDDNSFVPAPKKKVRRVLGPKDPNQQAKPTMGLADPAKKSASTLDEVASTKAEREIISERSGHVQASGHAIEHQHEALITEGNQ
ncbi:hypothetical protein MYCTH_2029593, partial [Thermothelomyces thermophilus ATCC 42464]